VNKYDLHEWAQKVISCAKGGRPIEDSYVEVKSELPKDFEHAARQLAGHANAASGEDILWLIGIREDGTLVGAKKEELAKWYPRVHKRFDGPHPRLLKMLNVSCGVKTLVAMLFSTADSPYLVNKADGGREVPWREGNFSRHCTRAELVSLLSDAVILPQADFLSGRLFAQEYGLKRELSYKFHFTGEFYLKPRTSKALTIPIHDCEIWFKSEGFVKRTKFSEIKAALGDSQPDPHQIVVKKPGTLRLEAYVKISRRRMLFGGDSDVEIVLRPVNCSRPLVLTCSLPFETRRSAEYERAHNPYW